MLSVIDVNDYNAGKVEMVICDNIKKHVVNIINEYDLENGDIDQIVKNFKKIIKKIEKIIEFYVNLTKFWLLRAGI